MQPTFHILLTIGGIMMLGLATHILGSRTPLPRVTLMMLFGVLIGREMFDLIPSSVVNQYDLIANMALLMVGFLLGGQLTRNTLASLGSQLI